MYKIIFIIEKNKKNTESAHLCNYWGKSEEKLFLCLIL